MHWIGIVALSVAACIVYGILHDQITARICVEYFTIGHAPVFPTQDPTLLGIGWGVIATWWVGAILGFLLANASRLGSAPKVSVGQQIRPVLTLMVVCAALAALAGYSASIAASRGWIVLTGDLGARVPVEKHIAFLTDLWAHNASYLGGFVGGMILMVRTLHFRYSRK